MLYASNIPERGHDTKGNSLLEDADGCWIKGNVLALFSQLSHLTLPTGDGIALHTMHIKLEQSHVTTYSHLILPTGDGIALHITHMELDYNHFMRVRAMFSHLTLLSECRIALHVHAHQI